jgi:hypothetical protein
MLAATIVKVEEADCVGSAVLVAVTMQVPVAAGAVQVAKPGEITRVPHEARQVTDRSPAPLTLEYTSQELLGSTLSDVGMTDTVTTANDTAGRTALAARKRRVTYTLLTAHGFERLVLRKVARPYRIAERTIV